jgi:rhodanese-related sulfurtransferase
MIVSKKHRPSKPSSTRKRFPAWLWIFLAAVAVLAIGAILVLSRKPAAEKSPSEISISQAYEKYQQGVFFLDVRTQAEWDSFHIPNTTLIPLDQLPTRLNEVPQDREIVVVCRSGNRSKTGRDQLRQAGYDQVTSMSGGVNAWQAAGYPVEGNSP